MEKKKWVNVTFLIIHAQNEKRKIMYLQIQTQHEHATIVFTLYIFVLICTLCLLVLVIIAAKWMHRYVVNEHRRKRNECLASVLRSWCPWWLCLKDVQLKICHQWIASIPLHQRSRSRIGITPAVKRKWWVHIPVNCRTVRRVAQRLACSF